MSLELIENDPRTIKLYRNKVNPITVISPYETEVIFNQGMIGYFGRTSIWLAKDVITFGDIEGVAIETGHYVEQAKGVSILTGGEHNNHSVINSSFSLDPVLRIKLLKELNVDYSGNYSRGKVTIGSGVVISMNVTICSGVTIGNGAVIGANSVVTKDVPPYAIAAGCPARVIRYRFDEKQIEEIEKIRWWDLTDDSLVSNYEAIQNNRLDEIHPTYREINNKKLVFRQTISKNLDWVGVRIGDGPYIDKQDLPEVIRAYMMQMGSNSEIVMINDNIFDYINQ